VDVPATVKNDADKERKWRTLLDQSTAPEVVLAKKTYLQAFVALQRQPDNHTLQTTVNKAWKVLHKSLTQRNILGTKAKHALRSYWQEQALSQNLAQEEGAARPETHVNSVLRVDHEKPLDNVQSALSRWGNNR
jgi:hypothetical protein